MIRHVLAGALALALVSCASPDAEIQVTACGLSVATAVAALTEKEALVGQPTPADAARIVAGYNATDPVSNYAPERVYLARPPGAPTLFVVLVAGDCVLEAGEVPVELLAVWVGRRPVARPGRAI